MFRCALLALFLGFLPVECAWTHGGMKLETLVRNLGETHPWTPEKVTEITGVRLESAGSRGDADMKSATTAVFAEGLTLREIDLRIRSPKLVIGLMVLTVDPLPCMTLERLRKTWPDLDLSQAPSPHGNMPVYFSTREPWGKLSFGFLHENFKPTCLQSIAFLPNESLEALIHGLSGGSWHRLGSIEFILSARLTGSLESGGYRADNVEGIDPYEPGLRFERVWAELETETRKISRLELRLARQACFPLARLRRDWPGLPHPVRTEQETIRFTFDPRDCLESVVFTEK